MHRDRELGSVVPAAPLTRELERADGPVRTRGEIHVRGDIPDLCDVRAGADVVVAGTVEAADVAAGRDATIAGGIVSRKKGICRAARNVSCRFATYATIEAGRNLHVACDLAHCQVNVGGQVVVSGRILAGQTTAALGIECRNAGSSGAVMTVLTCGIDSEITRRCEVRLSHLDAVRDEERRSRQKLELLRGRIPLQGKTHPDLVWQIEHQCTCVRQAQGEALACFERLCGDFQMVAGDCPATVAVTEMLHPGVILRFPGAEAKIDSAFVGPLRVVCKAIRGERQILIESGASSVPLETRSVLNDPMDRMRRIVEIATASLAMPRPAPSAPAAVVAAADPAA